MSINEHDLTTPTMADLVFNDVDELTQSMTGWDSDWRQLEAGQSQNQIEVIAGQHTVLQRFRLSHSIHQQGKSPSEWVSFGFPCSQSHLNWRGRDVTGPVMVGFNGERGYDCVSKREFRGISISVSKRMFSRMADQLGLQTKQFDSDDLPRFLPEENDALRGFPRHLHNLFADAKNARLSSKADRQFATSRMDEELVVRLLTALAESRSESVDLALKSRQKGLRLAIEFIEANCQSKIGIPDICTAAGLSWRSLDRAFKEILGIGPKRYLLNLKLTQVRRQLTSVPPNTKIVDIANNWGFWHMGDFAREYRVMFGELPNETLARR